jgi:Lon protease-like protein
MSSTRVIPIFPLSLVQFPGAITPLHIFEPRYRKLLEDVTEGDKTFGIIYRAAADDAETMGASELLPLGSVGCTVEVAVAQGLPDGRSNVLCVGGTRFRLTAYVEGEPYQQAEVEFFDDEIMFEDLAAEAERARKAFQRLLIASRRLKNENEREVEATPDLPDDPQALSFIVTAYLDIEASEKQELLELTDTGERLRRVNAMLEKLADDYEKRAIAHHISKNNGHGGKLPKF